MSEAGAVFTRCFVSGTIVFCGTSSTLKAAFFAIDVVSIVVLGMDTYFPRHRRRDMLAYMGLNVGVMAVTLGLSRAAVGAGFGLGLFGVSSIIRPRSSELNRERVAHYLAALTTSSRPSLDPGRP